MRSLRSTVWFAVAGTAMLVLPAIALGQPKSDNSETKPFDQLIATCIKSNGADPPKARDSAEACEKLAGVLKTKAELDGRLRESDRTLVNQSAWRTFGWAALILLDILVVALTVAVAKTVKSQKLQMLSDLDGKPSFSRTIGLFGACAMLAVTILLLNLFLSHLFIVGSLPEGIVSLLTPILAFIPTLFPYLLAKREEGIVARARAEALRPPRD